MSNEFGWEHYTTNSGLDIWRFREPKGVMRVTNPAKHGMKDYKVEFEARADNLLAAPTAAGLAAGAAIAALAQRGTFGNNPVDLSSTSYLREMLDCNSFKTIRLLTSEYAIQWALQREGHERR